MNISIGNDHAGPDYKQAIVNMLKERGHQVTNHGTDTLDSVDYPDFAHKVGQDVDNHAADLGVVICGSAQGVSMTVNKYQNVRGAVCWTKEIAGLAREHNNANIICIPARFTSIPQAIAMVETFLDTEFAGGRHANRVNKIACS
ncbi:RpiB/LacA/LacB family sugar-phosphate isomerase [Nonlabens ulvanivorans]|uniref:Ribose 5-phosphate isomerase n=1 Tax=Nonlabens ulvanivorans TaxID=906888 RepID=A0A084JU24_NONUL|nr:RpiB/LacA/LacB family sugar-phosphate isomerase [Nonlabens ulvanivorans]KEZ92458.1 ribose 5-phosphate isomerase [Nonlabens ulvanivorans]PRX15294.1 ribose 5-phosphate isomerase B [Nonlabens ulvanivorans]WOI22355.1 RpiB/LacA/LacB family sugar-phosphate isomerase [Nonlabens ulvanivorans]GAK98618.1 ribose 5-phosphate isomerase B [Nonlabens ulvanivorans]